ncbi:unnamed protein product, partial [Ectocarpus sp. 4 AP-2014]
SSLPPSFRNFVRPDRAKRSCQPQPEKDPTPGRGKETAPAALHLATVIRPFLCRLRTARPVIAALTRPAKVWNGCPLRHARRVPDLYFVCFPLAPPHTTVAKAPSRFTWFRLVRQLPTYSVQLFRCWRLGGCGEVPSFRTTSAFVRPPAIPFATDAGVRLSVYF